MNSVSEDILDALNDFLVYHELMAQIVKNASPENGPQLNWQDVLEELLLGEVEIGNIKLKTPDYTEFIAWKGTVNERISRAVECVNNKDPSDPGFSYYIGLRKNVDRYEGEEQQESDQNS